VNEALCKMTGYSESEIIEKPFTDFLHPDEKKGILKLFYETFKQPKKYIHLEFRVLHKNGDTVWFYSNPTIFSFEGKIAGFYAIIQNITERKNYEQALHESKESYQRLVNLSPSAMTIHSDFKWVFINKAAMQLYGAKTEKEILGKSLFDFIHPDYHETAKQRIKTMIEKGIELRRVDQKLVRKDGKILDLEVSSVPFHYHGRTAVQVIARDITEQKEAERMVLIQRDLGIALDAKITLKKAMNLIIDAAIKSGEMNCGGIYILNKEKNTFDLAFHKELSRSFLA